MSALAPLTSRLWRCALPPLLSACQRRLFTTGRRPSDSAVVHNDIGSLSFVARLPDVSSSAASILRSYSLDAYCRNPRAAQCITEERARVGPCALTLCHASARRSVGDLARPRARLAVCGAMHAERLCAHATCCSIPRPVTRVWHHQTRGLAKRLGNSKSSKSKSRSAAREEHEEDPLALRKGVPSVVFECPSPTQFTVLSSIAFLQIAGWTWMMGSNVLGYSTGSTFIVSNWWCAFGLALSSAMATMTYWHSAHHLVRLAVKPDVVDELIITTHTMIGGERTRSATRFDVVPNKYASQVRVR